MPIISSLQKNVLNTLEQQILPVLARQRVPMIYADASLRLPTSIQAELIEQKLLQPSQRQQLQWPRLYSWPQDELESKAFETISFACDGDNDVRLAVSEESTANLPQHKPGIYAIQFQAPALVYVPQHIPHGFGKLTAQDHRTANAHSKTCFISFTPEFFNIHIGITQSGHHHADHSLRFYDAELIESFYLFGRVLKRYPSHDGLLTNSLFFSAMSLLREVLLQRDQLQLANTAYPWLETVPEEAKMARKTILMFERAVQFIQMRLHENLSPEYIAQHVQITPRYLNSLFKKYRGVPVMKYVAVQRVNAAKRMLEEGDEQIQEISRLVGYDRFSTFNHIFKRETGVSPSEYRYQSRTTQLQFPSQAFSSV